jgi:2-amino-4-hydroxy-6-hydroxymethyldihydropteridine diphosphokinase
VDPVAPLAEVPVAIALGSNLGDRRAHLDWAIGQLASHLAQLRASSFHETAPVDVKGPQPHYLNAVVVGRTTLGPRALLDLLLDLERARGRERPARRAPRTLDLDLILYGGRVIDEPGLIVPHPEFHRRAFVLVPLAEVAADWKDPRSGRTVGELARERPSGLQASKPPGL